MKFLDNLIKRLKIWRSKRSPVIISETEDNTSVNKEVYCTGYFNPLKGFLETKVDDLPYYSEIFEAVMNNRSCMSKLVFEYPDNTLFNDTDIPVHKVYCDTNYFVYGLYYKDICNHIIDFAQSKDFVTITNMIANFVPSDILTNIALQNNVDESYNTDIDYYYKGVSKKSNGYLIGYNVDTNPNYIMCTLFLDKDMVYCLDDIFMVSYSKNVPIESNNVNIGYIVDISFNWLFHNRDNIKDIVKKYDLTFDLDWILRVICSKMDDLR